MSFFKIGVDLNGMSASEYLPLCQSFTNRTYIRNGRRFDLSEKSQIIEKNICCGVILSGLIQLKSIPRTEYIVLPYNIRMPALWISFDDWILSCPKRTIQDNAYTTSNKLFGIQKLTPSSWVSMNCYQNDYGWKSSEDKVTAEIHILSMIRSMNIIQIGKSSIAFR